MIEYSTVKKIAKQLQISEPQIKNVLKLLDEGSTVPFIFFY